MAFEFTLLYFNFLKLKSVYKVRKKINCSFYRLVLINVHRTFYFYCFDWQADEKMVRKIEIIKQIRGMEAKPVSRVKQVDLTESSRIGLLSEMSIAELRKKLEQLKVKQQETEEMKRNEIQEEKQVCFIT